MVVARLFSNDTLRTFVEFLVGRTADFTMTSEINNSERKHRSPHWTSNVDIDEDVKRHRAHVRSNPDLLKQNRAREPIMGAGLRHMCLLAETHMANVHWLVIQMHWGHIWRPRNIPPLVSLLTE